MTSMGMNRRAISLHAPGNAKVPAGANIMAAISPSPRMIFASALTRSFISDVNILINEKIAKNQPFL
jgi:hypothetical protein